MEENETLGTNGHLDGGTGRHLEFASPASASSARARETDSAGFKIGIGRTVHLPRRIVEQALCAHIGRVLSTRGLETPDPVDFFNRASVQLEPDGSAIVAWEE